MIQRKRQTQQLNNSRVRETKKILMCSLLLSKVGKNLSIDRGTAYACQDEYFAFCSLHGVTVYVACVLYKRIIQDMC